MYGLCFYRIKVKGSENACFLLMESIPLINGKKEIVSQEGTADDYTLIFKGYGKGDVDICAERHDIVERYSETEMEYSEGEEFKFYNLQDKSFMFNCEIFYSKCFKSQRIFESDSEKYEIIYEYEHYKNRERIYDECPEELSFKDKNMDEEFLRHKLFEPTPSSMPIRPHAPTCKVKFRDGRAYWYIGDYELGDIVYVSSTRTDNLGIITEKSTIDCHEAFFYVLSFVKNVPVFNKEEFEELWDSMPIKERRLYLFNLDFDIMMNKKKYLSTLETLWIKFAIEGPGDWEKFSEKYKKVNKKNNT